MSDQHWERVKEIFHRAARQPVEERGEFLDAACGEDDKLRLEVEELLASHDEIGDDSLTVKSRPYDDPEGRVFPVEGPGTVIDRYKALQEIGEGGMGVVYLAQQERPVRRQVALKIIKLGMDTKEVIARFEAERQALAIMDHPNIAKVFDAGATQLGRPYFVMEHIAGIPITDYCDRQRLNAEERLRLFIPVCHAIHHAHQKGIIHRDVKPSNVLVTVQDGKAVPKVIDFGVAKAVNQRLTERTFFTEQGVLIGTPVYMSPEQADMTGLNVDTTTDVYSLGALLYELLAGVPPFDPISLREAGLMAIHHMIREVDPPKPSTRFSSLGDEVTTVAERRRTEPAALERQISGELDWITMRAMEKDRTRRYQSATEFAADIERYLQDEPVAAGPPTTAYRVRKFARRHKAGVGLAAAVIVVLVGFGVTMTMQANRIARERDRARLEAERSRAEARVLQSLLMEDSDLLADSSTAHVAHRAREAWELHRRSLAADDALLALHAVNLLFVLDISLDWGAGDKTTALEMRDELEREALGSVERAFARGDTTLLQTYDLMVQRFQKAVLNNRRTDLVPATLRLFRGGIAFRRETLEPGNRLLVAKLEQFADFLADIGRRAFDEGRWSDAEVNFRELLEVRLEIHPPESGWTYFPAIARGLLGETLTKLGRYAEAESLLRESFDVLDTRDARVRLIALYESWGRFAEAERLSEDLWVESVREMGPMWTPEVRDMELGSSCFFVDRSVWVFRDWFVHSEVPAWGAHRPNRWTWTTDLNASDGIRLYDPPLETGGGRELLPLTTRERAFNDDHAGIPAERWLLWPGTVVADPDRGRALIVYQKVRAVAESPQRDHAGYSLAVWPHPDSAVVRPIVRPESEYPTMLFQGDEPRLGDGAVTDGEFLYLYASKCKGLECGSIVARAPMSDALERSAWRFYTADGKWSSEWNEAAPVVNGARDLSLHWNEYLDAYLAIYTPGPFGSGIAIKTAPRPEGPWSAGRLITEGVPAWNRRSNRLARAHPEFARVGGRVQYATYYHPTGPFGHEIRLVEITLK